ncbi:hypothetical protein [Okeania sp. SIO3B5]|uniref:hypothetical protein n=1 Tax=Okeania sp. SIO3B5 TaxID=2607811 RepID=UPI0035C91E89
MSNLTAKLSTTTPVEIPSGYLNIMGYVDESEVNGPGCRAVVWVQGFDILPGVNARGFS